MDTGNPFQPGPLMIICLIGIVICSFLIIISDEPMPSWKEIKETSIYFGISFSILILILFFIDFIIIRPKLRFLDQKGDER